MPNNETNPPSWAFRRTRLLTDRKGIAAVEFAMVATVMLLFVVAILDIGSAIQQRMVLQQAARAAGLYAQSFPTQTTGISRAVAMALPQQGQGDWSNVTMSCQDASGGQAADCSAGCGSGNIGGSGTMVVTVCRPYTTFLFHTGNCTTLTGNCVSYAIKY